MNQELILASESPRRAQLLEQLGLRFRVVPANLEERIPERADPEEVERLAVDKALAVGNRFPQAVVIGADTVVVVDGYVLGKPGNEREAISMLQRLSGREHTVVTGIAVYQAASHKLESAHEETRVWFRDLDWAEIEGYVLSGEPLDKAGAYGIQGLGAALVRRIEGCYFNVVGLPVARLVEMLKEFNIRVL